MEEKKISWHRVITLLDRGQMEYLDKLGKDSLFSTGHKLTYNDVLRELLEVAREARVDAQNAANPEEFKAKLLQNIHDFVDAQLKKKAEG